MNTEPALGGLKTFTLSAPSLNQHWETALAPLEAYRGLQCLLGWDAQLIGFGAMLRGAGLACLVTPAPELFFTQASWHAAAKTAGITAPELSDCVHVRFGPGRFGRVLRGVPNLIASAEIRWTGVMAPGAHPLRDQSTAPHAMRMMLDLSGAAGALRRPDGTPIPKFTVPTSLIAADIPTQDQQRRPLRPADFAGLEICGVADFSVETWNSSFHERRLMLEFNANGSAPARALFLLPWNLANPASLAPDLTVKYLRAFGEDAGYVALMPFNAPGPVTAAIRPALQTAMQHLPEDTSKNLLILRMTSLAALNVLSWLGAIAVIDGLDPEAAWTRDRLGACGFPSVTLAAANEDDGLPDLIEKRTIEVSDAFGRRFFESRTLPARDIPALAKTLSETAKAPRQRNTSPPFQEAVYLDLISQILATATPEPA
jgi:hypothetical protein